MGLMNLLCWEKVCRIADEEKNLQSLICAWRMFQAGLLLLCKEELETLDRQVLRFDISGSAVLHKNVGLIMVLTTGQRFGKIVPGTACCLLTK